MLTLYFAPGSSSFAAHIALHEVGAAFESRPLSFAKGEQRAPAYLALNPEGKVPTLVIDGRPLTEVAGMLFYLAWAYPQAALQPGDAEGEAQRVARRSQSKPPSATNSPRGFPQVRETRAPVLEEGARLQKVKRLGRVPR